MKSTETVRQHVIALRALAVFSLVLGIGYPLLLWLVAQLPGLRSPAEGSIITDGGKPVASALLGQAFTDAGGRPLPQYFQGRPSAGDYDPMSTGGSNLGPESIVDSPARTSLLTQVCTRSREIGERDGVDGARAYCTARGVGAVLSVVGPRDARGSVIRPLRVVSVNEPCGVVPHPFLARYRGVAVECAAPGEDYSAGQLVPVGGSAPDPPAVPADAVTAGGSGLDPDISPAYAALQIPRVARARRVSPDQLRTLVDTHRHGRTLGFLGEPGVNVVAVNLDLDRRYPVAPRVGGG